MRIRQIVTQDASVVIDLLSKGFPARSSSYWETAWNRLASLKVPEGTPQFGYLLENGSRAVGLVLLLSSRISSDAGSYLRGNLSSWYVDPEYRSYAALLLKRTCKDQDTTYLSVSAAPRTYKILEALGFKRFSDGQFASLLSIARGCSRADVRKFQEHASDLPPSEIRILTDHASFGCECLVCFSESTTYPFIFVKRKIKGWLPVVQLVYCRDISEFVRFARPLGIYFAKRGIFFAISDSNGPVQRLPGKYFEGRSPKYFRGSEAPRLGDLTYTEISVFGI